MNIISSILNKELNQTLNKTLTIIWTPTDNSYFTNFISRLNHSLISYHDLYFGDINPNLIICNNKILHYDQVVSLSIKLHLPILVIDHAMKTTIDNNYFDVLDPIPSSYHVAINKDIYNSWGKYHHQILNYDINDNNSFVIWNNLLHQLSNRVFNI